MFWGKFALIVFETLGDFKEVVRNIPNVIEVDHVVERLVQKPVPTVVERTVQIPVIVPREEVTWFSSPSHLDAFGIISILFPYSFPFLKDRIP